VKALWERYAQRFDTLTLRERAMVSTALVVALVALAYTLMIEPEMVKNRRMNATMQQKQAEMKAFEAQVTTLIGSRAKDPDRAERERLAALNAELAGLEARIAEEERKFTAPSQMRAVIGGLLARSRGVSLVEMKTLAPTTIAEARPGAAKPAPGAKPAASAKPVAPAKPAASERLIYRHALELTLTGSYLDLLAYVRDLEQLPTQLYWDSLELDAADYPKVAMKLTVFTLSLDRAWLNV
jgi:MSHA biogenesis protein MshJ